MSIFITGKPIVDLKGWAFPLSDGRFKIMGTIGKGHLKIPAGEQIFTFARKLDGDDNVFESRNTIYRVEYSEINFDNDQ